MTECQRMAFADCYRRCGACFFLLLPFNCSLYYFSCARCTVIIELFVCVYLLIRYFWHLRVTASRKWITHTTFFHQREKKINELTRIKKQNGNTIIFTIAQRWHNIGFTRARIYFDKKST